MPSAPGFRNGPCPSSQVTAFSCPGETNFSFTVVQKPKSSSQSCGKSSPILHSAKTLPVLGMFTLKKSKRKVREGEQAGEQVWCWIFVLQTLWLSLVLDLPSTEITFSNSDILRKCIKVYSCVRSDSHLQSSQATQGQRHVYKWFHHSMIKVSNTSLEWWTCLRIFPLAAHPWGSV